MMQKRCRARREVGGARTCMMEGARGAVIPGARSDRENKDIEPDDERSLSREGRMKAFTECLPRMVLFSAFIIGVLGCGGDDESLVQSDTGAGDGDVGDAGVGDGAIEDGSTDSSVADASDTSDDAGDADSGETSLCNDRDHDSYDDCALGDEDDDGKVEDCDDDDENRGVTCSMSGTTYYVDDIDGSDENDGLSPASAWRSLARVNETALSAGDAVLFRAGGTWYETLEANDSGSEGDPIVYSRYGVGDNPLIATGDRIDAGDWVQESEHIYSFDTAAVDPSWLNPWAMVGPEGTLRNKYWWRSRDSLYTAPSSPTNPNIDELESNMQDGFSWSPSNQGKIFVRSNDGNPGSALIGRRRYGFHGPEQSYLVIDSLAFEGPGGAGEGVHGDALASLVYLRHSPHCVVRNCELRNNVYNAINFHSGGSYNLIENNVIENTGGGISGMGETAYVTVRGNQLKNIGAQIASIGDRGCISTWGHHWVIENNTIENHGWPGQADSELVESCESGGNCQIMDRAITSCCGHRWGGESGYHIIRNNRLKNIGSGGLTLYGGGHNEVYNNVIDGWNLYPPNHREKRGHAIFSVYLPASPMDAHDGLKIYHNVIVGGKRSQTLDAAIYVWNVHRDLEIKNNIVFGNDEGVFALASWLPDTCSGIEIQNNIFSVSSGDAFLMQPTTYSIEQLDEWQSTYDGLSRFTVSGNTNTNPGFIDIEHGDFHLAPLAFAIDQGIELEASYGMDPDGTARPQGSGWDIGVYEF